MRTPCRLTLCFQALVVSCALVAESSGQIVWSGLTKTFTKVAGSDHTQPGNHDIITPNVILTRGDAGGLINFSFESGFVAGLSPEFTEWATDLTSPGETIEASNWSNLTFTPWLEAFGGQFSRGDFIPNRRGVLYLTAEEDDIYIDLQFLTWEPGHDGGYSYIRAEPPQTTTGDYNGDDIVDAADYTLWRDTLGQAVDNPGDGADGDLSGEIDLPDYQFWKDHYGGMVTGAGAAAMAVPEPATTTLLFGGLLLLAARRRADR